MDIIGSLDENLMKSRKLKSISDTNNLERKETFHINQAAVKPLTALTRGGNQITDVNQKIDKLMC